MPKVAILLTILDGNEGHEPCLEECRRQVDAVAAEGKYSFDFFLNNEGAGGYQSVWKNASAQGADFYLWMDHDLMLSEGALASFMENSEFLRHKAVIAGTVSRSDRSLLFGGRTRRGKLLEPDPVIPIPCHLYDMALVLVPAYAFSRLENPSDLFRRHLLDYGYGSRVARAGVPRVIAPGIMARTDRRIDIPVMKDPDRTPLERARDFLLSLLRRISRIF